MDLVRNKVDLVQNKVDLVQNKVVTALNGELLVNNPAGPENVKLTLTNAKHQLTCF